MVFYAVANGRNIGIFSNWTECNNSVKGYKNAMYKKFDTKEEADCFIQNNQQQPQQQQHQQQQQQHQQQQHQQQQQQQPQME